MARGIQDIEDLDPMSDDPIEDLVAKLRKYISADARFDLGPAEWRLLNQCEGAANLDYKCT